MSKIIKKSHLLLLGVLFTLPAYAICPLCTFAIGAGIGLTQWLGIDDTITGLWIGALNVSLAVWTIAWLDSKNIHFIGRKILVFLLYYGFTIIPLYSLKIIGHPFNILWGMDKLLLGIIIGTFMLIFAIILHLSLKKLHHNRSYFPLQKVAIPVILLIIASFIFYFITR